MGLAPSDLVMELEPVIAMCVTCFHPKIDTEGCRQSSGEKTSLCAHLGSRLPFSRG